LSYWAVVVARNADQQVSHTLDSLLQQTLKAKWVTVVDDGSSDDTGEILRNYERRTSIVSVLTLPDRGYDIRRVPSNINLAWKRNAAARLKTDFFMISGDDCFYPANYVEALTSRMHVDPRLVVASGRPSPGGNLTREHSPSGSGRMVRCSFWIEVGGVYPLRAGWESWLLYEASRRGLRVRLFDDLKFKHIRPRGTKHQFVYWGAAMGTLGYHPLYALGRITKNALTRSVGVKGSVNMLRGYIQSQLGSEDSFISPFDSNLREFVTTEQSRRIQRIISGNIAKRITTGMIPG